jgi:hypothetical protein
MARGKSMALWLSKLPTFVGGFGEKIKMDVVK